MAQEHPTLTTFFNVALDHYLIPDLKRLRHEIRPEGEQKGCTVATAMFAFSLLDLLGFLMRPEESPRKEETFKNVSFVLSRQAALFPALYASASHALVKLFRHGIMHQVFPKACGIAKPSPPIDGLIFYTADDTPNLNVDVLVDDLLTALTTLRTKAESDASLADTMDRRLSLLQAHDIYQRDELCEKGRIPAAVQGSSCTVTTTTTTA